MTSFSSELKNFLVFVGQYAWQTVGLGISCIIRVELIALGEIVIEPWREE